MGKSLKPLLDGTVEVIHPANEAIAGEMFNNTSVRMGDWKATIYGFHHNGNYTISQLTWERIQTYQTQHPDILKTLIAAYDKYAQDVGVVIPRGEKFEQTAKNNFPSSNSRQYPNY